MSNPNLGPQFKYPTGPDDEGVPDHIRQQFAKVHRLYGSGDLRAAIPNETITTVPWPRAPRSKSQPRMYDAAAVRRAVSDPGTPLYDFDPRELHASQSMVTYSGVNYYMGDEYQQTGETYADRENRANKFPTVYANRQGMNVLVGGHHRAMAALLRGQPLRGRRVEGDI